MRLGSFLRTVEQIGLSSLFGHVTLSRYVDKLCVFVWEFIVIFVMLAFPIELDAFCTYFI